MDKINGVNITWIRSYIRTAYYNKMKLLAGYNNDPSTLPPAPLMDERTDQWTMSMLVTRIKDNFPPVIIFTNILYPL